MPTDTATFAFRGTTYSLTTCTEAYGYGERVHLGSPTHGCRVQADGLSVFLPLTAGGIDVGAIHDHGQVATLEALAAKVGGEEALEAWGEALELALAQARRASDKARWAAKGR